MTKEEFIKGALKIFDKNEKILRKKLAKEELAKCGVHMPNVEHILNMWVDFNALLLRTDADHSSFWIFLDLDQCERDKLEEFVGNYYDFVQSFNKM